MSRLLCFLAGLAVALAAPVTAAKVETICQQVVSPEVKCDPTALNYNRAPLECETA